MVDKTFIERRADANPVLRAGYRICSPLVIELGLVETIDVPASAAEIRFCVAAIAPRHLAGDRMTDRNIHVGLAQAPVEIVLWHVFDGGPCACRN